MSADPARHSADLSRRLHRDPLIAQNRPGAASARLICYSATGFTDDLRRTSTTDDVVRLVGATDLHREP